MFHYILYKKCAKEFNYEKIIFRVAHEWNSINISVYVNHKPIAVTETRRNTRIVQQSQKEKVQDFPIPLL